ncbi:cytochrome-c peroxidase [Polluticaenibacter yanchengensis]|uniref:Cytochrome-c peroxidase n=1 Tax=Polluticaenibacter yanchengensis TaxID=3014562 RepID=A0ABT4UP10_9BACT|nr:cytochrome-c peroxidase [Chitinophagaceae bacterium LY-5]
MKLFSHILQIIIFSGLLVACRKSELEKPAPQPYRLPVPVNFPAPQYETYNPLTKEGIELGRQLFYDVRLSGNNKISCASCHHQNLAFSDGISLTNIGVSGTTLSRHSPTLINMAWANNGLFWDGGSTNLESQAFGPLTEHNEMGQNLFELMDELKAVPGYITAFKEAFDEDISSANVVKALAQFQRTMVSANSRYDKYVRKENGASLNKQELKGMVLVKQKCQGCHSTDLFTDNLYHNNGIDNDFSNPGIDDLNFGRYRVSYNMKDMGAYKTPTLRNIMLTAPYMHDGRFKTIEEVLNHYTENIKYSESLSPVLIQNGKIGITINNEEKQQIIAFLHTLTDEDFISRKSLGKP